MLQLPIGRACIDHYRSLNRPCVFSHEELVCKMAADPDNLDLTIAASTHLDLLGIVEIEKQLRKKLLDRVSIAICEQGCTKINLVHVFTPLP